MDVNVTPSLSYLCFTLELSLFQTMEAPLDETVAMAVDGEGQVFLGLNRRVFIRSEDG